MELIGLDLPVTPGGRQTDTLPLWLATGLRTSVRRTGRKTDGRGHERSRFPPRPPFLTVSPAATLEPVAARRAADSF